MLVLCGTAFAKYLERVNQRGLFQERRTRLIAGLSKKEDAVFDLGSMTDKFSETGQKVIYRAIEESRRRDHNYLSVEHIFTALGEIESQLFGEAMQSVG